MKTVTPLKNALMGAAAASLIAAPAAADLNYYWTYSEGSSPGEVVNTLNFISTADSFIAALSAQTLPVSPFLDPSGDLMPTNDGSQSFFSGGYELGDTNYEDPILVGSGESAGGSASGPASISGGNIDATWISNWPEDSFPTGDTANPIMGGQFTLADDAEGNYGFYLANADEFVIDLTGSIDNGRFSQRLPGDANMDGNVDFLDLSTLAGSFGSTGVSVLNGDFNGDNVVDFLDLSALAGNFGTTSGAALTAGDLESVGLSEFSAVLVPEPTSLALLALGGLFVGSRRRR